jgi:hypothetical protein
MAVAARVSSALSMSSSPTCQPSARKRFAVASPIPRAATGDEGGLRGGIGHGQLVRLASCVRQG